MPSDKIQTPAPLTIDNTDWLKSAAIILVAIDHFGFFFVENAEWWSVLGRLAAPVFFFLIGFRLDQGRDLTHNILERHFAAGTHQG